MNARYLALTLMIAAPAAAQTPPDNVEIRAAAQAFDDAQLHGDRAVLERMLAPDYLLVHGSGRIGDKKDFIDGFTDPNAHLEPFDISDRLFIRPSPDTAIVGGEAWVHGTDHGKPFKQHFRYSDTFARRNSQWMVVYTQVTPLPAQ
ncbi:MAG TPA: nuclear transport factor 2 family protein [Sphingomonas sp.]|uniref:nuclear transport factor 2 family protein n=1 Tax=Sphingomonas sp. TaxID=28214 RepID=UPI002BE126DA|nr:nuclear transport factor 2 family protein [Sphingomonas sp.]HMI18990.1 nuclear transport factor 2 family protein [Sphingomonas sp.]